LIFGVI